MDIDSGIKSFSYNKKGMSPLIATMLLIAFAVALGTMVITWGSSLGEDTGPDCSAIAMVINPYLCYGDNMIKMSLKNIGEPIEAVTVKISDENAVNEISLKNSKLGLNGLLKRDIPYEKSGITYIRIYPSVMHRENIVLCNNPVLQEEDLPQCSS